MSSFHDRSNPGPRPVESQRLVMMTCPTGHRWVYLDGFGKKTCDTCNQPPSHRELYGHVLSPHEIERVCDLLEQVGPINLSVHDPTHEHDPPGRDVTLCETCRRSTTLPSADERRVMCGDRVMAGQWSGVVAAQHGPFSWVVIDGIGVPQTHATIALTPVENSDE